MSISLIVGLLFARGIEISAQPSLVDFRAAYCESSAAAHGLDPYRLDVVARCEAAVVADPDDAIADDPLSETPGATNGFSIEPLAPFALAVLAPLALLPYGAAVQVYLGVALVLISVGICALRHLTGLPFVALAIAFALGAGVATFAHGTVVPITLACVCLAGVLLRRGEDGWAGLVAAGTLLDPLVGIAICATLAIWRPATRPPLAFAAVVVALLSGAALGPSGTAEYYFGVLPSALLSDAFDGSRYGVACLLHVAGFGSGPARATGLAWDVLVVASSIPIARRVAREFRSASAYVVVPPAVVLLGGSVGDLSHVALAIPACCIALVATPLARLRALCALVLIAVPWPNLFDAYERLSVYALHARETSEATMLAAKLPTWIGLLLLFLIVTRSSAPPVAVGVRSHAAGR